MTEFVFLLTLVLCHAQEPLLAPHALLHRVWLASIWADAATPLTAHVQHAHQDSTAPHQASAGSAAVTFNTYVL